MNNNSLPNRIYILKLNMHIIFYKIIIKYSLFYNGFLILYMFDQKVDT